MTTLAEPTATAAPTHARSLPLFDTTRAELRRILRWPATWVLAGVWLFLNALFGYIFDWISYRTGDATGPSGAGVQLSSLLPAAIPDRFADGMPMFGGAIVMILGALAVGSGYGWGTWKTVYTRARPGRPRSAAPWSRCWCWWPVWCWSRSGSTSGCPHLSRPSRAVRRRCPRSDRWPPRTAAAC